MRHILEAERRSLAEGAAPGSLIDRVDPRTRIIACGIFAIVVVTLDDLIALGLGLCASLALMAMAQMPLRRTLHRMIAMDGFILIMLVLLPFTIPGEPAFQVCGLTASWPGLLRAAEIGLKANAIILALMSLVGSMNPMTLGHALRRLWIPPTLISLLIFTVRYIDVLHQEYQRLRAAMKARGFRPRNNRHTYRTFGHLVGMMLVRAVDRSERILDAMKCRGFNGQLPLLDKLAFSANDVAFSLAIGATLIGVAAVASLR